MEELNFVNPKIKESAFKDEDKTMKTYKIDENTLKSFMAYVHYSDLVDYLKEAEQNTKEQYIADCIGFLPWAQGLDNNDILSLIEERNYDIPDLINDQVEAFWEVID